ADDLGIAGLDCGSDGQEAVDDDDDQRAFEDLRVGIAAGEGAEAVGDVHDANSGDGEFHRGEERRKLDDADRREMQQTPGVEHELRTPYVIETVIRRRQRTEAVEAPAHREIKGDGDDQRYGRGRSFTHCVLPENRTTHAYSFQLRAAKETKPLPYPLAA